MTSARELSVVLGPSLENVMGSGVYEASSGQGAVWAEPDRAGRELLGRPPGSATWRGAARI
jgi:hypothetical protein